MDSVLFPASSVVRKYRAEQPARLDGAEDAMNNVLEFPSKIFLQWGAIAQEIVSYLARGGASKEEIRAIVDRLRIRWEQQETLSATHDAGVELSRRCDDDEAFEELEAYDLYVSRHWRSQTARTLIRFAMADFQRNTSR